MRSAVIIKDRKNAIFVGKGYVFYKFYERLQESMRFNLLHWKGLLFDWTK